MPLIHPVTYEPKITEIKSESDLAELILDIKHTLGYSFDCNLDDEKYLEVLKIIEKEGKYDFRKDQQTNIMRVNLRAARNLISAYRQGSEGGCVSCKHLTAVKPFPDDTTYYCGLDETADQALNNYFADSVHGTETPKIRTSWEHGCAQRAPKFARTVEEVLEDVQAHGLIALRS